MGSGISAGYRKVCELPRTGGRFGGAVFRSRPRAQGLLTGDTMKLLQDENLSRKLIPFLQHDYPGSSQVVLMGLESASDSVVWQTAKDHDFVIVTRDADFEELSLV